MRNDALCEKDNLSSNGSDAKNYHQLIVKKKNLVSIIMSFSNDKIKDANLRRKKERFTENYILFFLICNIMDKMPGALKSSLCNVKLLF